MQHEEVQTSPANRRNTFRLGKSQADSSREAMPQRITKRLGSTTEFGSRSVRIIATATARRTQVLQQGNNAGGRSTLQMRNPFRENRAATIGDMP